MRLIKLVTLLSLMLPIHFELKAYEERDLLQKTTPLDQVKSMIVYDQGWVPYPDYADRTGWDKLTGEYKQHLIEQGEAMLNYEWKVIKATDFLEYDRTGNRNIMQHPNSANNNALSSLFLAELAEGKGRFIDQIINGVFLSCEQTSWVLSAHLSAQHSRKALPEHDDQVIDLGSGEKGAMLSWVYYFLHDEFDKVNPAISERLMHELKRRILDVYLEEDRFWWMAVNYKPGMLVNNWNPWCNFNVLLSFLLVEPDQERVAQAVVKSMVSVDKFINYTHADGACEEGPSYWGHAAGKMYDYLELLATSTAGRVNIFEQPQIRNMGEYIARSYIGNGWVVNFADASAKGGGDVPLIYRYGEAVDSDLMKQYAAFQFSKLDEDRKESLFTKASTDLYRTFQTLAYKQELDNEPASFERPSYSWYPETEFCYMSNKSGDFFAAKGGYNNESHNHNDAGTFSFYVNDTPIIIDAGVGTYTRETFSSKRYSIWTMQSDYHNLPKVNGYSQKYGSKYKATDVKFDRKRNIFSANLATAYPAEANVEKWIRTYRLTNKGLKIEDDFSLKDLQAPNQINFLVWGDVNTEKPGSVILKVDNEEVVLKYDKDLFSTAVEVIQLPDSRLSNVWGEKIYRLTLEEKNPKLTGKHIFEIHRVK